MCVKRVDIGEKKPNLDVFCDDVMGMYNISINTCRFLCLGIVPLLYFALDNSITCCLYGQH